MHTEECVVQDHAVQSERVVFGQDLAFAGDALLDAGFNRAPPMMLDTTGIVRMNLLRSEPRGRAGRRGFGGALTLAIQASVDLAERVVPQGETLANLRQIQRGGRRDGKLRWLSSASAREQARQQRMHGPAERQPAMLDARAS